MLDMTVFTEMTPEGRKLDPPSEDSPVYYVAQPDGFRQMGTSVAGEKPPTPGFIDHVVRKALAVGGYKSVPSTAVRPALLILYRWGTHNAMSAQLSEDFQRFADAETLERAHLIGGKKLVKQIVQDMSSVVSNFDLDDKREYLKDQAFDSCYFVVLFAYDFDAAARGERRLYWRTNMTVNSTGVSLRETLRPLIASSAPFIGREMAEAEITSRPLNRREKVELGTAIMVDYEIPLESDSTSPPKSR